MSQFINPAIVFCCCASLVILSGCGGSSHNSEPATFALNTDTAFTVGQTRRIENTNTTIKLDAVTQDNRDTANTPSPPFVGGQLIFRLLVSDSSVKSDPFIFSQFGNTLTGLIIPQTQARSTYRVNLSDIEPRFGLGSGNTAQPASQKDYKITLRVAPQ